MRIRKPQKKHIAALCVCLACLLLAGALQIVRTYTANRLSDLHAAERFAPDGGFAQISCFFAQGLRIPPERTREFSFKLESGLVTNAIEPEEEDARLVVTCHAAEGSVELSRAGKQTTASAIGTGGDYFFFHPVPLVSGMYYTADALSRDQVLIDETLAWQLFGGFNVEGQTLDVEGRPHVVRGVVKAGKGRMREAAGSAGALVYLPVETLLEYGMVRGTEGSISSFEAVLPNPVRGFAADLVNKQLAFEESEIKIVDHGIRFENRSLFRVFQSFGTRSMSGALFSYPFWENIARGTEDIFALLMMVQAVLLVVPVSAFAWFVIQSYRHKKWTAQGLFELVNDRIYESQAKKRLSKQGGSL